MFEDLSHGWHSNAMGVTYLPLPPFSAPDGSSPILVTDVHATKLLLLTTIRYHEDPGHAVQHMLPLVRLKRLAAALGYEALGEVMRSGSMKQWLRLQRLNQFIGEVDAATRFDAELLATVIGFSTMRANLPARFKVKIKEFEDLSVAIIAEKYSNDKKQKAHAPQLYRELAKLVGDGGSGLKGVSQEHMRVLEGLRSTSLFGSIFPDQLVHCEHADDLAQLVQAALRHSKRRLSQRDLTHFNPLSSREIAEQSQFISSSEIEKAGIEIAFSNEDWFTLQTSEADHLPYIEFDKKSVEDPYIGFRSLIYIARAYIDDLLLNSGHDFPVEVTIGDEPGKIGFYFIRLETDGTTQPLVVPYLTGFQRNDFLPTKDDLIREASIHAHIAALIFFETLRVMIAFKRLVGCPMRWIPWAVRKDAALEKWSFWDEDHFCSGYKYCFLVENECCGRIDLLMRLYEAGKKAGFPAQTWRKPTACLSGCPPCQGTDVSGPLAFSSIAHRAH